MGKTPTSTPATDELSTIIASTTPSTTPSADAMNISSVRIATSSSNEPKTPRPVVPQEECWTYSRRTKMRALVIHRLLKRATTTEELDERDRAVVMHDTALYKFVAKTKDPKQFTNGHVKKDDPRWQKFTGCYGDYPEGGCPGCQECRPELRPKSPAPPEIISIWSFTSVTGILVDAGHQSRVQAREKVDFRGAAPNKIHGQHPFPSPVRSVSDRTRISEQHSPAPITTADTTKQDPITPDSLPPTRGTREMNMMHATTMRSSTRAMQNSPSPLGSRQGAPRLMGLPDSGVVHPRHQPVLKIPAIAQGVKRSMDGISPDQVGALTKRRCPPVGSQSPAMGRGYHIPASPPVPQMDAGARRLQVPYQVPAVQQPGRASHQTQMLSPGPNPLQQRQPPALQPHPQPRQMPFPGPATAQMQPQMHRPYQAPPQQMRPRQPNPAAQVQVLQRYWQQPQAQGTQRAAGQIPLYPAPGKMSPGLAPQRPFPQTQYPAGFSTQIQPAPGSGPYCGHQQYTPARQGQMQPRETGPHQQQPRYAAAHQPQVSRMQPQTMSRGQPGSHQQQPQEGQFWQQVQQQRYLDALRRSGPRRS
ncbi:uncharacterized protein L3040_002177 [Drepanopeziza brunnea f. sp. 'multigermtubi']|uniref:uncharacterized protein n=1 Tax=Drepanopeziza brunnea f. sp. 'multigermtubi' TaxID=698441 RepID=UPI0023835A60|nr:hypothetical protein L3040_002177 [Drepanopeziza brunnea f. sp. 'multigermtubi']